MSDLYMPASGTEGADFDNDWCARCKADQAFRDNTGDSCEIASSASAGVQVEQWRYERGEPVCTAFEAIDRLDQPQLKSSVVRDLFPGAHRRPTQGAQIRSLVVSAMLHPQTNRKGIGDGK